MPMLPCVMCQTKSLVLQTGTLAATKFVWSPPHIPHHSTTDAPIQIDTPSFPFHRVMIQALLTESQRQLSHVVVISGDVDFVQTLANLKHSNRINYHCFVNYPPRHVCHACYMSHVSKRSRPHKVSHTAPLLYLRYKDCINPQWPSTQ